MLRAAGRGRGVVVACLLWALCPSPALGAPEPERACAPERLCLAAARLRWWPARQVALAEGEVRLRLRRLSLRAPRLLLSRREGEVRADLGATLLAEWGTLRARTLRVSLDGERLQATRARLVHPLARGRQVRLTAERLERRHGGLLLARHLTVTSCACASGQAAWQVRASRARVILDRGALLFSPVLEVAGIPVFWLPAFYLPLGSRRSGLLTPRVGYSGRAGAQIVEPVFLVLGRSYDLTLEPGIWFGRPASSVLDRSGARTRPGPKGPSLGIEVRYAPARRSRGQLRLDLLYDLAPTGRIGEGPGSRGVRGRLDWHHRTVLSTRGAGSGLAADLALVSDAALISDLGLRLEERQVGYLRSSARAWSGLGPTSVFEGGARYLQDLSSALVDTGEGVRARPLFGPGTRGVPGTLQTLPELHLARLPRPLALGILAGASADLYAWVRPTGAAADGSGLAPHLHLHATSVAERPFHLGSVATGSAEVALHGDLWQPWRASTAAFRLWPEARVRLRTVFLATGVGWQHRIVPRLEVVWARPVLASGSGSAADAWSVAVAPAGTAQVAAALASRFRRGTTRFDLEGREGWDWIAGGPSELEARALLRATPLTLRVRSAWSWSHQRASFVWLGLSARAPRGIRLGAHWVRLEPWASAWLRQGLSELFAAGAVGPSILPQRVDELVLSTSLEIVGGLSSGYTLRLDLAPVDGARPPQHELRVGYRMPCKCAGASLVAVWLPGQRAPEVRLNLDLAGLGG